ncbi:MAG: valine--tRNA ligase, partial [Sphaerochaetaceae bacterium]|nr:valine--tRNA ligase [Sphaerochaetaceae bacterium]
DRTADVHSALPVSGAGFEAFIFVREALDVEHEIERLEIELEKTSVLLDTTKKKLANEKFMNNAKQEAIEKEHAKKAEFEEKIDKGTRHLHLLKRLG